MRLVRAIDRFLEQKQLEEDWTPRTLDSYYRVLIKLADDHGDDIRLSDFDGRHGTDRIRATLAKRWARCSAGRRANVISILHSFFAWAEDEGFVDDDPARRIKRPPRRRADVYRPGRAELELGYHATALHERAAWVLLADRGLRASTVVNIRWADLDLRRGLARIQAKGGHRDWVPLGPTATERLQDVYRQLDPDGDDYVFTVEHVRFTGHRQTRLRRDPKRPATTKALLNMVKRVCKRAGVRALGTHALRHGFATNFLRASGRDDVALQGLLGHSSIQTTMEYVDDLTRQELSEALARAAAASSGDATSVASVGGAAGEAAAVALQAADGPERSRTSGRSASASDAEREHASDDPEADLAGPKGPHKQGGARHVSPSEEGGPNASDA